MCCSPARYGLLPSILVLLALPWMLPAQEPERQPVHIYEAYYKVNFGELDEWTRDFETYSVPVLEQLRSEGVIEGWGHWQHNVGSEYNVRFGIRFYDWASIDTFWNRYLERLMAAMPEAEQVAAFERVEAHYDEIWDIADVSIRDGARTNQMYASTFRVGFADGQEWNRIWRELVLPILGEAMDAGILNGVVLLSHNTGPAHNHKVLYLFEEWDHMDDMWNSFFQKMGERHPEELQRIFSLVRAHDDVIWSAAPTAEDR